MLTAQLRIIVECDTPMQRIMDVRMLSDADVTPHIKGDEPFLDEGDERLHLLRSTLILLGRQTRNQ